jgi:hypothetical protein
VRGGTRGGGGVIIPYGIEKILSGQKTQHRIFWKPGFQLKERKAKLGTKERFTVLTDSANRTLYKVGNDYPVQAKVGATTQWWRYSDMTGVGYEFLPEHYYPITNYPELLNYGWRPLRVKLTYILYEDWVIDLTWEEFKAEGFTIEGRFYETWCKAHDPKFGLEYHDEEELYTFNDENPDRGFCFGDAIADVLAGRPEEKYHAAVLCFQLVQR